MEYVIIRKYYNEEMYLGVSPHGGSGWFFTPFSGRILILSPPKGRLPSESALNSGDEFSIVTLEEFEMMRVMVA